MPYSFARQKGLGKWGEKKVIEHLRGRDTVLSVTDVSDDKEWRKKGIDILIRDYFSEYPADIKMDRLTHRTGNIFVETVSSEKAVGNIYSTEAKVFIYFDPFGKKLITFNCELMREYLEKCKETKELKTVKNEGYESKGYCISLKEVDEELDGILEDIEFEKEL